MAQKFEVVHANAYSVRTFNVCIEFIEFRHMEKKKKSEKELRVCVCSHTHDSSDFRTIRFMKTVSTPT